MNFYIILRMLFLFGRKLMFHFNDNMPCDLTSIDLNYPDDLGKAKLSIPLEKFSEYASINLVFLKIIIIVRQVTIPIVLLSTLSACLTLFIPVFIFMLLRMLQTSGNSNLLHASFFYSAAFFFSLISLQVVNQSIDWLKFHSSQKLFIALSKKIFQDILNFHSDKPARLHTGTLLSRISMDTKLFSLFMTEVSLVVFNLIVFLLGSFF